MAEGDPARGSQPEAQLLRAPAFRPQLTGEGAPDPARQFARLVSNLLLAGLRLALRLLKAVAPLPRVPGEFPAHGSLAEAQGLADLGLRDARLPQGIHLTSIFVGDPTICAHQ